SLSLCERHAARAGCGADPPAAADAPTLVDPRVPSSSAGAPAHSTSTTLTVTYSASDLGSGLDKVELWAHAPGAAGFSNVATDSSPAGGGSFSYATSAGDGSYGFYTVAVDKAGNREVVPANADATTLVDTQSPASGARTPPSSSSSTIAVSYTASDSGSGVDRVELWAQAPGETSFSKAATDTSGGGSFSYTAAAGDGSYSF